MKKVKILVVALMVLMVAGGMLAAFNFSEPGQSVHSSKIIQTRSSDVEYITTKFVIDQNTTDPLTGEKGRYGFDSSIVVNSTGELIVKNATVYFLADIAHPRYLEVFGSLILYNSTLTLGENQIQPVYFMNVTINGTRNPGAKVDIEKSHILYNGWFNVVDKKSNIFINDTVFDKMVNGAKYGPTPDFVRSVVKMDNVSFNNMFEHSSTGDVSIGNLTSNGGVTVTPGQDQPLYFTENINPQYSYYWKTIPVKSVYMVLNYSTSDGYNNTSKIQLIYNNVVLMSGNILFSANDTNATYQNTTFSSADLTAQQIMDALNSSVAKVIITAPPYQGKITVNWCKIYFTIEKNVVTYGIKRFDFNLENSTIFAKDLHVAADFNLDYGVNHNRIALYDNSTMYVLNLTVENTAAKKDSCIFAADDNSDVYIFRYAKIHVAFNNISIPNMFVNATPYLVDSSLRNKVINESRIFIENMGYGNISSKNVIYAKTDASGNVSLPLLSDIVNRAEWPNSRYVGIYNVWVNGTNEGTYVNYYNMQVGLDHFPNLQASNNTLMYYVRLPYYRHVDVGVSAMVTDTGPYLVNKPINISAVVTNSGTQDATGITLTVYVRNTLVDSYTLSLAAGASSTENFQISGDEFSSSGLYNITVTVSQMWDTNPANNKSVISVKVDNLAVTDWNIDTLIRHHVANVSLTVYSQYAITNTTATFSVDGVAQKTWTDIPPGSWGLSFDWLVDVSRGYHTFSFAVNGTTIWSQELYVHADVDVGITNITVSPAVSYVNQVLNISITAVNYGRDLPTATNISVVIYDPFNNPVYTGEYAMSYVGPHKFYVSFKPALSGTFSVYVSVLGTEDYNSSNNQLTTSFEVNPTPIGVTPVGMNTYVNGTTVRIELTVSSAISDDLTVTVHIASLGLTLNPVNVKNPIHVGKGGKATVEFNVAQKQYESLLKAHTSIAVVYTVSVHSNATGVTYVFPSSDQQFYFVLKEKPDFEVIPGSFMIVENTKVLNGKSVAEGVPVTVKFSVANVGGMGANLTYEVKDGDKVIKYGTVGLMDVGAEQNISFNYTMKGVKVHDLSLILNANKTVSERSYTNNLGNVTVNVIAPVLEVTYHLISQEHNDKIYEGDHVVVIVMVLNKNATEAIGRNVYVQGAHVTVQFGSLGVHSGVTNSYGIARIVFVAKKSGSFKPTITASYYGAQYSAQTSSYKVEPKPLTLPWLWIIIAVILVGIAVFFLYGYMSFKKESSDYMVCGNCGHLIPADAEKCPYCGVVFEKDKVQCPDCGSWIDADSKYCTVCGSVFMEPTDKEYDKYVALRERYNQYLEKYKEEARKYIGENYKNEEFFKWWKTHPEYISFQEWVKRQEEEIEGETVKCTVCGALNPKGAKICRVCGSVLPGASEEPREERAQPAKDVKDAGEPEQTSEKTIMDQYKEEYEKIKHPGVVSFEEWVKRKQAERGEAEPRQEAAESKKAVESEKPKEASGTAPKGEKKSVSRDTQHKEKMVEEKVKEGYIKCPVCGALNKPDAKVCAVCGSPIERKEKGSDKQEKSGQKPVVKKKVIKKVVTVKKE